ncbi:MAG TPA: lysozyme inhibitor LprI family protein [Tabrizicola sp.]|nr:lysozyme inhibitor LprI family protein [Tabrizicola sp.]
MIRVVTLACLFAASPALAEEVDCATAMAQQELNICAEMDWQAADKDLNAVYKTVLAAMKDMDAVLPPELQGAEDALRTAQRAWIDYRDAQCETAGFPMRGGSAEPLLVYGCLRQVTENRTAELLALLDY